MKLINLKCSNCGANLTANEDLKQCTCNFCGSVTLIDDEIIKVEHKIIDSNKEENFKRIDGLLKIKYYKDALEDSRKLIKEYPHDPKAWIYMIKAETKDFKDHSVDLDKLDEFFENYITLETDSQEKLKNKNKYNEFVKEIEEMRENGVDESDEFETLICPYCSKKIDFGDSVCENCGKTLYWPNNA